MIRSERSQRKSVRPGSTSKSRLGKYREELEGISSEVSSTIPSETHTEGVDPDELFDRLSELEGQQRNPNSRKTSRAPTTVPKPQDKNPSRSRARSTKALSNISPRISEKSPSMLVNTFKKTFWIIHPSKTYILPSDQCR